MPIISGGRAAERGVEGRGIVGLSLSFSYVGEVESRREIFTRRNERKRVRKERGREGKRGWRGEIIKEQKEGKENLRRR